MSWFDVCSNFKQIVGKTTQNFVGTLNGCVKIIVYHEPVFRLWSFVELFPMSLTDECEDDDINDEKKSHNLGLELVRKLIICIY